MRKISADYIFPVSSAPVKNGLVIVDDDGRIMEVISSSQDHKGDEVEHYSGIIVPGFINAHCHLELSYLKNKISKGAGLDGFLQELEENRKKFSESEISEAALSAEREMIRNGIVAVGDISNSSDTFSLKENGDLLYHTFIELFGIHLSKAGKVYASGCKLADDLRSRGLSYSITPHAPYSLSAELLDLITSPLPGSKRLLSIHLAENPDEKEKLSKDTYYLAHLIRQQKTIDFLNAL